MSTRTMKAFTLGELLVVISIVAVLAAILFPIFQQARDRATTGACLTNMVNLGTAMAQYSQDYDGQLVKAFYGFPADCTTWTTPEFYTWRYAIKPYVPTVETFACPQNKQQNNWENWVFNTQTDTQIYSHFLPSSYATNDSIIGFANGQCVGLRSGINTRSQIPSPAKVIMLTDARAGWPTMNPAMIGQTYAFDSTPGNQLQGGVAPTYPAGAGTFMNHAGYVHFLMLDGHTRSMKLANSVLPFKYWDSCEDTATLQGFVDNMPAEYN